MGPYPTSVDNSAAASASASVSAIVEDSPSSGRSFFSRFSFPLRPRTRNVADFHIRPAEPHRKYNAGDHVQGAVILTVLKPVRITHLTVSLHGYVRVYKGPSIAANEPIVNPAEIPAQRGSRLKYHGNGHASLFQDEQVLSSDGRLEPGRYEFNFELLFPAKGLPSSIDFERGTISYLITATLTRPTSISPTTSCERKIYLVDRVDIGPLAPPRPRTIYLEPISKRSKKKKQASTEKGAVASDTPEPASDFDSTRVNENSTEGSLSVVGEDLGQDGVSNGPRSPVHSDIRSVSGDSAVSGSTGLSRGGDANHAGTSVTSQAGAGKWAPEERTITATIELLKGGCLAGDTVPVRISVQHIKRIKSMHGVIVTLYRQGRIDSAPPVSLFKDMTKEEARRIEKEEYYPKSKTGLGGLSLSSAGSCSVFRKDLSQAFSPLIIDPATLTASVTTSVRVPEDVFPTIKGVPGEMITFKYQIEVIVDLGGKLANQIQGGTPSGPRIGAGGGSLGMGANPYEGGGASLTSWGTSIIDTDRLRREKGVISVVFEVIVGTMDTSRLRGKGTLRPTTSVQTVQTQLAPEPNLYQSTSRNEKAGGGYPNNFEDEGYGPEDLSQEYAPFPPEPPAQPYPYWNPGSSSQPQEPTPQYIPPPVLPDENGLSEKERVRRAEERLLPSQPPGVSTPTAVAGPSNSLLSPDGENIYDAEDQPPIASSSAVPAHAVAATGAEEEAPSAPTLEELSAAAGSSSAPTEDKQELERRRLLAEASAPPEVPEDYDHSAGNGESSSAAAAAAGPSAPSAPPPPPETAFEPSAPVLTEDEEGYGAHYIYAGSSSQGQGHAHAPPPAHYPAEPLPRYER
ncbi:hypothetical protein QBC46DRAFT_26845 [Diplogelasinospora grovesii]|uniref:Arrestin C-terminal-like domain-containing protein n=1 Tax=Diplogelasinospora grovesii TaxID=303347 RepID=A0AAN6ND62_9PEZI|nr:hypothetical protein QBC46DRAFT_26845 [Diplogelasinospora grovesii]